MSGTRNNEKDNDDDSIRIKRSTFNKIALGAVAALAVATFFGGYILGGLNAGLVGGGQEPTTIAGTEEGGGSAAVAPTQEAPSGGMAAPTTTAPQQAPPPPTKVESISLEGAITKGKADAPVTMVDFSDFQCPFCKRHADETIEQIMTEYVDTGKVRYVFKHYPLDFHANARAASNAAECANEQGKFWEYHKALFTNQQQWETQDATAAATTFKKYATDLELKTDQFNTCVDSKKYDEKIGKELQEGSQYGTSGTPTFYIGNEKEGYTQVVGAQPYETFKQTIDQLLQEGG
jgi:protein-disulfide isomerase